MALHRLLREMADDDRKHDPWGACLGALGPICDLMTVIGEGSGIPGSAGYRPAMGLGMWSIAADSYVGEELVLAWFTDDSLDHPDLEYAARVLDRYADLIKAAGKDY